MGENLALGRVEEGEVSQGSPPCMKQCLLKCNLVVEINLGGGEGEFCV